MQLILVRHGQTRHNASRLALGRENVPLTDLGRAQAAALARDLSTRTPYGDIAAVYASPLDRARDTAAPIAGALGLPVEVDNGLIEMDVGEMEGISYGELRERFPAFFRDWLSESLAGARMPGGETLSEVQARAWAAVERIRDRHPDATAVAVTHNFVILSILCRALSLPLANFRSLRHDVAAVSVIEFEDGRTRLVTLNDRCHLEE